MAGLWSSIRNPLGALHLLQLLLVDLRQDGRGECAPDFFIVAGISRLTAQRAAAVRDAARRQINRSIGTADRNETREPDRILADRDAQQVVVALPHSRTDVAQVVHVRDLSIPDGRVPLVEEVSGAEDRLARDVGAE